MTPPVDGAPLQDHVLRSVHHQVSNLPFGFGGSGRFIFTGSPVHVSSPFGARAPGSVSGQLSENQLLGGVASTWFRFPVGFRPPAFASWTSCSRQRIELLSRSAYQPRARGWTLSGFPCSAHMRHDRGGCLLYSGAAVS